MENPTRPTDRKHLSIPTPSWRILPSAELEATAKTSAPSGPGIAAESDDDAFVAQHETFAKRERRTWAGAAGRGALAARRAPIEYPLPCASRALMRSALARTRRLSAGRPAALRARPALAARRRALRRASDALQAAASLEGAIARERSHARSRVPRRAPFLALPAQGLTAPTVLRIVRPPGGHAPGWAGVPAASSSTSGSEREDTPREMDDVLLVHFGDVCERVEAQFRRMSRGLYAVLESLLEQAEWVPPAARSFGGLRACFEEACNSPDAVADGDEQHRLFADVVKDELECAGFRAAAAAFLLPKKYRLGGTEISGFAAVDQDCFDGDGLKIDLKLLARDVSMQAVPALPTGRQQDGVDTATLSTALFHVRQRMRNNGVEVGGVQVESKTDRDGVALQR